MARSETEISSPFPLFHYRIHKIKNLNMKLEKGKKTTVLEKVKGGLSLSLFVSFASKKKKDQIKCPIEKIMQNG